MVKSTMVSNIIINSSAPSSTQDEKYPNYAGTVTMSAYNNLVKSLYFASIAQMYDQVRLDWVKVKITPTTSVMLQNQKQAIFVSAWDRNGLTNPKKPPNFAEICSYSSAFQRAINLQATSWSASRKIYASSVAEKSFFVPTSVVKSLSEDRTLSTGFNLTPGQSLAIPWNPQLLLGVLLSASTYGNNIQYPTLQNTQTWNFICEFEWGLTFKGLRYDRSEGGAPLVSAAVMANTAAQTSLGVNDPNPSDDISAMSEEYEQPEYDPVTGRLSLLSLFYKKSTAAGNKQIFFKRSFPFYVFKPVNGNVKFDRTNHSGACFLVLSIYTSQVAINLYYIPLNQSLSIATTVDLYVWPVMDNFATAQSNLGQWVLNYVSGVSDNAQLTLAQSNSSQFGSVRQMFYFTNEVYVPLAEDDESGTTLVPIASSAIQYVGPAGTVPATIEFPYHAA